MKRLIAEVFPASRTDRLWTWWRVLGLALVGCLAVAFLVSAGCSQPTATPSGDTQVTPPSAEASEPAVSPDAETAKIAEQYASAVAVVETSKGTFKFKLFAKDAPRTVASFAKLANSKFYDGLKWHRLVQGFVVQGGDPYSKNGQGPIGTGGPGYNVPAEFSQHKHVAGTVAMARSNDPNSAGSQFYIAFGPLPQLDGQYTVFGQVTSGMDVVRKLKAPGDVGQVTMAMLKNADSIKRIRVVGMTP